jgi:prepilin-type N-terminal cleavage/methylation domain-containing protein
MPYKLEGSMLKTKGFTLIEMIVVISIIGILASLAVPRVVGYLDIAKNSKAIAMGKQLHSVAMWSYSEQGGKFEAANIVEAVNIATGIQNITAASLTVSSSNLIMPFASDSKNYILTINAAANSYTISCDSKTIFSSLQQ